VTGAGRTRRGAGDRPLPGGVELGVGVIEVPVVHLGGQRREDDDAAGEFQHADGDRKARQVVFDQHAGRVAGLGRGDRGGQVFLAPDQLMPTLDPPMRGLTMTGRPGHAVAGPGQVRHGGVGTARIASAACT